MIDYRWNGVGLTTPDNWEPSALERDGFLLEDEGKPLCELKWRVVQGTFSFEKHLKRLVKGHKGVDMDGVSLDQTPVAWQEAANTLTQSGLDLHSFIWRTPTHKGIGAALHNPATGLAVLVQFFIATDDDETVAAETLASLRDFSGGKTVPWAMFGLSARTPAGFILDTFSFKPGHYMVRFWRPRSARQAGRLPAGKGPGTSLVFERVAPASVVLRDTNLETWVRDSLEDAPPASIPLEAGAADVRWSGVAKTSSLRRLLRRSVLSMGHVRTTYFGNAILAVRAFGVIPVSAQTFKAISESYELV